MDLSDRLQGLLLAQLGRINSAPGPGFARPPEGVQSFLGRAYRLMLQALELARRCG